MDYSNREFIANAMVDRMNKGYKIVCYPSRYIFKKRSMVILSATHGKKCMKCKSDKKLEIDHIKPISTHPELELDYDNVQILCRKCNASKGNRNCNKYINQI